MTDQTKRRLIGWRVRWEYAPLAAEWEPKCGDLVSLPVARRHFELIRRHADLLYRNVRLMRVYRRTR